MEGGQVVLTFAILVRKTLGRSSSFWSCASRSHRDANVARLVASPKLCDTAEKNDVNICPPMERQIPADPRHREYCDVSNSPKVSQDVINSILNSGIVFAKERAAVKLIWGILAAVEAIVFLIVVPELSRRKTEQSFKAPAKQQANTEERGYLLDTFRSEE